MQGYNQLGQPVWSSRDEDSAHRGRDRRGIRAGDLIKEARYDNDVSNPRVEVPYALTKGKHFRVVDGVEVHDRLTAADQALWHYLFARAKQDINALPKVGSDAGLRDREAYRGEVRVHGVTVGDMLTYLGIANPARLRESLERIAETRVRYDIRYRGTRLTRPVDYLTIRPMPEKLRSRDVVEFEIDPEVRVCMQLSRKYVVVDLNALTRFKSRYTARLYTKLSLMASRHALLLESKKNGEGKVGLNKRHWSVKPEDLARELGYPMTTYRSATFLAVMTKVAADIEALPELNKRFDVAFVHPSAKLSVFAFATTEARKTVFDIHRAWLGRAAFFHASAHTRPGKRGALKMKDGQFVHHVRIAQAQVFSGHDGLRISKAWRSDVEAANQGLVVNEITGWAVSDFLARIERFGAEAVFETWLTRTVAVWNKPAETFEPLAVDADEAIYHAQFDEDEEDLRIGDDWGDLYAEAA